MHRWSVGFDKFVGRRGFFDRILQFGLGNVGVDHRVRKGVLVRCWDIFLFCLDEVAKGVLFVFPVNNYAK
jgi:hypothetical protein